ncbi:MAG: hypothetical protein Q9220_006775 [cf. Caloplaca sp. 1 TL-2023]
MVFRFLGSTSRNIAYLGLIYVALDLLLVDDEEDESAKRESEKLHEIKNGLDPAEPQEKDAEEDEDTLFIPLGFAYKLPQRYYKGSDPEWQSFVELARDRKRCDLLKTSSMWASYRTMASLQYAKFREYFKLFSDPQAPSSESAEAPDLSLQDMQEKTSPQKQKSPSTPESEESSKKSEGDEPSNTASQRATSSDFSRLLPSYPGLPAMGDDMNSAMSAFKKTFAQTWRPASTPPERGTVMFSGMVELVGPKGVAVLDVRGEYHAAESRWSKVGIAVRRIQPKKQGPKGGK